MTYEELYRYHHANGDVALAQLYKELYEVQEQLDSLQKEIKKKDKIIWQLENDE
jgi:cell division septal protein FtsQ